MKLDILNSIGTFGLVNYRLKDCVDTYVTKIFEIPDLISILIVKIKKGGHVPLHKHKKLTIMIPFKGRGYAIGKTKKEISEKGVVHIVNGEEGHGFTDVTKNLYFVSINIGGRILSNNKTLAEEDFRVTED